MVVLRGVCTSFLEQITQHIIILLCPLLLYSKLLPEISFQQYKMPKNHPVLQEALNTYRRVFADDPEVILHLLVRRKIVGNPNNKFRFKYLLQEELI